MEKSGLSAAKGSGRGCTLDIARRCAAIAAGPGGDSAGVIAGALGAHRRQSGFQRGGILLAHRGADAKAGAKADESAAQRDRYPNQAWRFSQHRAPLDAHMPDFMLK